MAYVHCMLQCWAILGVLDEEGAMALNKMRTVRRVIRRRNSGVHKTPSLKNFAVAQREELVGCLFINGRDARIGDALKPLRLVCCRTQNPSETTQVRSTDQAIF